MSQRIYSLNSLQDQAYSACVNAQSCPSLCNPMNCSPLPDSSVHGILQTRILEWVASSCSRESFNPGIEPSLLHLLHWQADFYHWDTWEDLAYGKSGINFYLLALRHWFSLHPPANTIISKSLFSHSLKQKLFNDATTFCLI